ncbi:hypothetical protein PIB30_057100 [Stylosanthes scabra]|uniref:Uncharacterized protein n=1 Tax=Stylosanthes scabra TaxID=79078 RepID=A0ABU6WJF6_9FABA|nr:hypothetical protein [Stylosanthes scabra]
MAYRMLRYSQGKATSFLGHAHLWTRIFKIVPLDLTREEDVEPAISHAISSKNIYQMRRNLVDHFGVAENARVDAMADAQPRVETDAPAQIPTETGVPPNHDTDLRNLRDEFRSFHGEKMYMDFQEQPDDTPMQD